MATKRANKSADTVTFVLQSDLVKERTYKTRDGQTKTATYMNLPTGNTRDDQVIIRNGVHGRMGYRNAQGKEDWKQVDLSGINVSGYAFTPTRPVGRFTNPTTGIEYRTSNNWHKDTLVYLQNINGFDPQTGKTTGTPAPRIAIRAEDLYNALEDKKQRWKNNHSKPTGTDTYEEARESVQIQLVDDGLDDMLGLEEETEY